MARPLPVSASCRILPLAVSLLVLVLALMAPAASAQQEIFAVQIVADTTQGTSSGDCVAFQPVVRNTGASPVPPQHQMEVSFGQAPAGWRLQEPGSTTFQLAPGAEARVPFSVCPTGSATTGERVTVSMTVTATDDPRTPRASDQQIFTAELEEEGLFGFDLPDAALYVALVAILGLLGIVLLTRRRPSAGIAISCPEPAKEVLPDRGTSFPVRIRNEGRERDVVTLTTSPVPRGWDTFLPLVDIPLEPREEQTVWLSVKSPADAQPGDRVVVKVLARSASGGGEQAEIDTLVTVRPPDAPRPGSSWGGAPSPAPNLPDEDEDDEEDPGGPGPSDAEDRSVYGPEDEDDETRPVAVKRRKR